MAESNTPTPRQAEFPDDMELEFYIQFPVSKDQNLNSSGDVNKVIGEENEEKIWPGTDTPGKDEKDLLVILLGWAGAEHKYLAKYSDYYLKRGCIVLRYITPLRYHFVETHKLQLEAEKIVKLLRDLQLDGHPTFFHVFSNGGSFTYSYIIKELARVQNSFELNVKGTMFDSAPSPRSVPICFKALVSIFANLNLFRYVAAGVVVFFLICHVFWYHLKTALKFCIDGDALDGEPEGPPLTNWLSRISKIRNHHFLFLYSDNDAIVPSEKIEKFVEVVSNNGNTVEKMKFVGSEHVLHYKMFPKEYGHAVTEFIRRAMKNQRVKTRWVEKY